MKHGGGDGCLGASGGYLLTVSLTCPSTYLWAYVMLIFLFFLYFSMAPLLDQLSRNVPNHSSSSFKHCQTIGGDDQSGGAGLAMGLYVYLSHADITGWSRKILHKVLHI